MVVERVATYQKSMAVVAPMSLDRKQVLVEECWDSGHAVAENSQNSMTTGWIVAEAGE